MLGKVLGDLREKPDVGKSAWWTAWKTDFGKSALGAAWKTDVGKVRWAVCGKLMLEKVHDELREKLMLEKCLANCWESLCWKRCLVSCVENCRESDRKGVVSRKQSYKPQVEKTTVQASVGHGNESCFTYFITNFSEIITCLTTFWWNVTICAVWRMLTKCRILRALTHFGKMLRFTHFARHKILAARHFQLLCTPGGGSCQLRNFLIRKNWCLRIAGRGGGVSELLIFFMPPLIGSLTPTRSTYTYQELLSSVFAHVSLETLSFSARIATLLTLAGIATLCATTRKTTSHERYS